MTGSNSSLSLGKSKSIEEKISAFKDGAALKAKKESDAEEVAAPAAEQPAEVEVLAEEPIAQKATKNSPWRDASGLSEDQLRSIDKGISGTMSMELHLRIAFIKNRMNGELLAKGRKERMTAVQLHTMAIEEYTSKILKKWGYDL